ncbi:hypothetical protein D3C71_1182370 [compost metagenome]
MGFQLIELIGDLHLLIVGSSHFKHINISAFKTLFDLLLKMGKHTIGTLEQLSLFIQNQ